MPYIRGYQREKYYKWIKAIVEDLPTDIEGLDGHLNFVITQLVVQLIYGKKGGKKVGYHKIKCLIHTVQAAADELKRRHLNPYEDEKIKQNGDVVYENLTGEHRQSEVSKSGSGEIATTLPI